MTEKIFHKQISKMKHCERVTGKETLQQLTDLMFTPQGIEFCIANNFPKIEDLRKLDNSFAISNNIFIDANGNLKNVGRIAVFGNSDIEIKYTNNDKSHHILAMHGAKVKIIAEGYAVVFVESKGATIEVEKKDMAKVFVREY
jgi:hypothetical protein